MINEFQTIVQSTEGFYKEKGSKFLSFAYHVKTEEEIKAHLEALRKQYYDARHHCYAYIIGLKDQTYRANDDGEPNHSAGDPILGQIRSKGLTNCLVVVVRYFGGTKLGVGGLISAYKIAAEDALDKVEVIKIYAQTRFSISFGYEQTTEVERALAEFEVDYEDKMYTSACRFVGLLRDEDVSVLAEKVSLLKAVDFQVLQEPI
ncbi:MAG: YigZ family protein [Marinoscillum sp.]|uniref:IMPACT family protein n=1 Tax=Marinoscillum sp. TaxID=2024838 RepID=UPI0032F1BADB